ncbi:predicted protein [Chaetoceros tenuissimus]|uniref:Uncharacterized protein n=1 Tax=Chaetoceros tenuissimus TaxID=426638 RepID=A0AAD3H528_9STRA|nr:predicted protein [Chaetoceros tenuissimus]
MIFQPRFTCIDVLTDIENQELEIIVYGNPKAHQGPRFFCGKGFFGRGHVYNLDHCLQMQMHDLVQVALAPNLHRVNNPTFFTVESALEVELDIFMNSQMPTSFARMFILDASLQGVLYANNSRVVSITAAKSWDNEDNCNDRVHIHVKKINHEAEDFIVIDNKDEIEV